MWMCIQRSTSSLTSLSSFQFSRQGLSLSYCTWRYTPCGHLRRSTFYFNFFCSLGIHAYANATRKNCWSRASHLNVHVIESFSLLCHTSFRARLTHINLSYSLHTFHWRCWPIDDSGFSLRLSHSLSHSLSSSGLLAWLSSHNERFLIC